ncbi:MAG: STAS domain-containing protein [Verrucomicrobiota bacterium]|jgi:anti-anti-sigma regulatory factor
MSSANLSVFVGRNVAWIKIGGRANFASSPDFKTLLEKLVQKGYSHFIIELQSCVLMDSTFLGVLAGFGMKLNPDGAPAERGIELLNATERVRELLENLGAVQLFKLTTGELQLPNDMKQCEPESINPTHEQITRTSLEAHQTLMAINPENIARFKDVAQFLAEDLQNLEKCSD